MKLSSSRRDYFAVNAIFAGVILFIMGYSAFYSPDTGKYPVSCIHEQLTGEPCPSCGLSHAFSLIVRGRISEALEWNSTSLRVFLFFAVQLVMRAGLGAWTLLAGRGTEQVMETKLLAGRGTHQVMETKLLAGRGSVKASESGRMAETGKAAVTGHLSGLRRVTIADAAVSSAMALFAFYPFLRAMWISLF